MNLVEMLGTRAEATPERPAIIEKNRQITYGDLWQRVQGGARQFRDAGLQKGDPLLIIHPISIELYEVLLSAFHAGLVAVLLDPAKGSRFLDDCLAWFPVKAYFGSPKAHLLRLKSRPLRKLNNHFHSGTWVPFSQAWNPASSFAEIEPMNADDPALVTFTSGSTGFPKGVVRSHGFLLAQDHTLGKSLALKEGQIDLITLPVFLLSNLSHGLTSVIADTDLTKPGNPDIPKISEQIRQHPITRATASPAFFDQLPDALLRQFSEIYTGGAPVFTDLLIRLNSLGVKAHAVYGSTEAEPISHFNADDLNDDLLNSISNGGGLPAGHPVPGIEVKIIKDHWGKALPQMTTSELEALESQVGEILVSGDHVLKGYLAGRGDEETKITVDGRIWHRTGDAGRLDDSGQLWLLGRCLARWKDFYPLQIEAALHVLKPGWKCAFFKGLLIVEENPERLGDALNWIPGLNLVQVEKIPMDQRHNAKIDYPSLEAHLAGAKLPG